MKKMTCKDLGGPITCDKQFKGNTFEEIAEQSKKHGIEMFNKKDFVHLEAMKKMKELIANPEEMNKWLALKNEEFDNLPDEAE